MRSDLRDKFLVEYRANSLMRHSEREELTAMRDAIANRAQELDEQVSYGAITLEQKEHILFLEFGDDWMGSLRALNDAIHKLPRDPFVVPHVKEAALLLAVLACLGIVASLLYPGITGAVVAEPNEISIQQDLRSQDALIIPYNLPMRITQVYGGYGGTDRYTLRITDAHGTYTLLEGQGNSAECTGCGQLLTPPYLVELEEGRGVYRVLSIAFTPV